MRNYDAARPFPEGEHEQSEDVSLSDTLKRNARNSIFPGIVAVLEQREQQAGATKVNVDVPGFAHVDYAVQQLDRFANPGINDVRIPSTILQTTTDPEPDFPGEVPTNGPLPVSHEEVQLRVDHIYALVGAERRIPTLEVLKRRHVELISVTNLGPDIYAIEERTARTVAVSIRRMDNPAHHRRIVRGSRV